MYYTCTTQWICCHFQVIGQFIARAIADDCMAPKYVSAYKGKVDDEHKQAALDKAELLLSRKHGIVRLDNIWGTGGGIRPVKYLVKQARLSKCPSNCDDLICYFNQCRPLKLIDIP